MHQNDQPTTAKTQNIPAHDLGQMGITPRSYPYRGKYPRQIRTIQSTRTRGIYQIDTNDGRKYLVSPALPAAYLPKLGEDFDALKALGIFHINEKE